MQLLKRYLAWTLAAVAGLALTAMPAAAVIGGTEDTGNLYGGVALTYSDGAPECTGTLYRNPADPTSRRYVMTAAHCIVEVPGQWSVSFNEDGFNGPFITGTGYYNQGFNLPHNALPQNPIKDAAVIVLDQDAPAGIPMAELPSLGQVNTLPKKQLLTIAGFGAYDALPSKHYAYGPRFYNDETIVPGQGGTTTSDSDIKVTATICFGDSGGPNFIKGTNTTVGIVSYSEGWACASNPHVYRTDTADALNFLEHPTTAGVHQ